MIWIFLDKARKLPFLELFEAFYYLYWHSVWKFSTPFVWTPPSLYVKETLWPLFMDVFQLSQYYRATTRRQFTCQPPHTYFHPSPVFIFFLNPQLLTRFFFENIVPMKYWVNTKNKLLFRGLQNNITAFFKKQFYK